MDKLKHIISYLPLLSILLIMSLLPFHYSALQRFAMYSLAVTYVFDYCVNARWRQWRWNNTKLIFIAFALFSALTPIWQLFDPVRTPLYQTTMEVFSPFFFVGIAGFLGMTDKIRMEYVAWTMLSVCAAISVYLIYQATLGIMQGYEWIATYNWYRLVKINTHMVVNLYCNMALILGALVVFDTSHGRFAKGVTITMMMITIPIIFISGGRTGMISLVVVMMVLSLYYIFRTRRWSLLTIAAVIGIGMSLFMVHNPRMREAVETTNPRIGLWRECRNMIAERPVAGYGVCSAREKFVRRVMNNESLRNTYVAEIEQDESYRMNGTTRYDLIHPHNAFLETWSRFGIIGLILCLCCLTGPFFLRIGRYRVYLVLCTLAFLIQAMFESLGSDLQPLFLASMVLLFFYDHFSCIAPSAPTGA